jgi:hypothetical protein
MFLRLNKSDAVQEKLEGGEETTQAGAQPTAF